MVLTLAALVLTSSFPPVTQVPLAQSKVQIIKGGKKGGAAKPAPAVENAAPEASQARAQDLSKKSAELDAKAKELDAREAELKEKETSQAEEKKAQEEKQKALKKKIEKHGQQNAAAWEDAAGALSGD